MDATPPEPEPIGTADLCDRSGDDFQVCHAPLRSYGAIGAGAARIACLRVFEDAGLLRQRLQSPGQGRLLVCDGGDSVRRAIFGDRLAGLALQHGWAGVVLNGAVRDVAALAQMPLAVLALGSVPVRGGLAGTGEQDVALRFGDACFLPGALLVFDRDGVLVSRRPGDPRDESMSAPGRPPAG